MLLKTILENINIPEQTSEKNVDKMLQLLKTMTPMTLNVKTCDDLPSCESSSPPSLITYQSFIHYISQILMTSKI